MNRLEASLRAWATHLALVPTTQAPLAVAYSGGADSAALVHIAQHTWPGAIRAIHVNHGLQAAATPFESHCRVQCAQWGLPLEVTQVRVALQPGDSLEEQARLHRYAALAKAGQQMSAQAVLLAQHANDQAETLLLALSRGAGLAGLSAMGSQVFHHGMCFGRPWLGQPQALLRQHVEAAGLPVIDDPSNLDLRHTRNRIRHVLMPVLTGVFPAWLDTSARSARHCAQAQALLDAQARDDAAHVGTPPNLRALQELDAERRTLVLRLWLREAAGRAPSEAQLHELMRQIEAARTRGHRIQIKVAAGWVQRQGAVLTYQAAASPSG